MRFGFSYANRDHVFILVLRGRPEKPPGQKPCDELFHRDGLSSSCVDLG
jgi:hypothetical protein